MKFIIVSLLAILLLLSCSSSKKISNEKDKCPRVYKNSYTNILNETYTTVYKNDTINYSEVRFECVNSAFKTHKVVFDKYGKWDDVIFPSNSNQPILIWNNLDLLSNGKKYTVYTNGKESWKHIYASVMVFDEYENDALKGSSPEKQKLIECFSKLIKRNKLGKVDFHDAFKKMINSRNK